MASNETPIGMKQLAEILDCSPRTITRYIRDKGLKVHKMGGFNRFYMSEVNAWLRRETHESDDPHSGKGNQAGAVD